MSLHQQILQEPVTSLPLREAITVSPETPVREAGRMMREKKLGCVVVTDSDGRPTGTFTESALIQMLATKGDVLDAPVKDHLAEEWASISKGEPIARMLASMQRQDLRFVVVTDEAGKVCALTGQKGLMEYIADYFPRQVLVQRVDKPPIIGEREGA